MIEEDELISKLQDFGLSQADAEVYLSLLRTGPSRVSQISKFSHTNRVKGYRILENLKKAGFVYSTFSCLLHSEVIRLNCLHCKLQD